MDDRNYLTGVIIGGLVGGFGSWVWATVVGPAPLIDNVVLAIPSYIFLGGIAGFLGVFLVAKTDPKAHSHAIAFAVACGLFWGPVISGAKAMVSLHERDQELAQAREIARGLADETRVLAAKLNAEQGEYPNSNVIVQGKLDFAGNTWTRREGLSDDLQASLARIRALESQLEIENERR